MTKNNQVNQIDPEQPPEQLDNDKQEEILDMSLQARMARARADLDDALTQQNKANALVQEKTKALDVLILEEAGTGQAAPINDIQFYLNRQQRKREENAAKRAMFKEQGIDPVEIIKSLDGRAPIDIRGQQKKIAPGTVVKKQVAVN